MTTRRRTLAQMAALAMAPLAMAPLALRAQDAPGVIVIGAGMAGLAAARALTAQGRAVTILEARARVGGRVWTSDLWPGQPVDMGASWIHGNTGNPITALADAVGAARVTTSTDAAILYGPNGAVLDIDADMVRAEALIEAALGAAHDRESDQSVQAAIEGSAGWRQASGALRRVTRYLVNAFIEHEYAGSWADLSAWDFDEGEGFDGPDQVFPGGYGRLPQALARGLQIRLGAVVRQIEPGPSGVRVHLADGTALDAAHAVVSLPLGVLQSGAVRFGAPLAPARVAAIAGLGMGLLNKCWLRFDAAFWPADVDWIGWMGPQDGGWGEWVSMTRAAGQPLLLGFNAADQARGIEGLSDAATVDSATAALRAMFGSAIPAPRAAQVTRWAQDPYARGSYSYAAVGMPAGARAALAGTDWDGALVFAGEATSTDNPATVHGAWQSGLAAAQVVLER